MPPVSLYFYLLNDAFIINANKNISFIAFRHPVIYGIIKSSKLPSSLTTLHLFCVLVALLFAVLTACCW